MTAKLLELIAAPENLLAAWRAVRGNIPKYRRQRAAGPDGVSLTEFEQDLPAQLKVLRAMLLKGRYQPMPPAFFAVPKRGGGQRMLAILPVRERVAQRATQQVLEPIWEPGFLPCSFGFRPGISLEQAVVYVQSLRSRECGWVVDGDIAACFDSLDHDLLVGFLKHKVRDGRVMELMQAWLDAGILQAGPPENVDMQSATRVEAAKNFAKKGFDWVMDSIADQADPYGRFDYYYDDAVASPPRPQPGAPNPASPYPERDAALASMMRRSALRRVITSGLMLGVGFVRARAGGLFVKAGEALKAVAVSPAGRRLLKKSSLATGGLAGLAAAAAVTAYLLKRKAGPSPAGVLQGSPLSPLLANIYLHPFDVNLTNAGHQLARFADDWVILCPSQEKAELAYNDALRALAKLHLKANLEKTRIL
ncbi:MAG: reverse transcriptase domain-containing protein, partial [Chloroflexota bacterium]